jgi:hypothetical protein
VCRSVASVGKKSAEKSSNGISKSSKSKSEKESISREMKKPRRNSPGRPKDVVETQNSSPLKKNANTSSSNFANNLLRQNSEPTEKNLLPYSQLSNTAPKSTERGSVQGTKHSEHTLGLSDSSRTHKRKSNSISVLVAQAMELNKDEKSSSEESDSSTDNSSDSSSNSDTDDKVPEDSDEHLSVVENNKSHSKKVTLSSIEKELTSNPPAINSVNQTKKTHYDLLPLKKKVAKNEDISDSNEYINSGANTSLSVEKPSYDVGYIKKQNENNCMAKQDAACPSEAFQGVDTKMESLLPEIICDFADFMHTLAVKVAYQTKYNWTPKCFVHNETEDVSKKPLKKKIHKDPNEPRRPLSSFNLWCEYTRKKLKEEEPNRSIGLQELASMWKLLSPDEKVLWEDSAKEQKEIYLKQMEVYKMNSLTPVVP